MVQSIPRGGMHPDEQGLSHRVPRSPWLLQGPPSRLEMIHHIPPLPIIRGTLSYKVDNHLVQRFADC